MIDGTRIVHEVRYPHPAERVWHALTDPAALAAWLMPNDFVAVVGHRFRFDARPGFGVIDCEVLDIQPPHLLRWRWDVQGEPTTVTITLRPDGDGVVLRLEHDALPPDAQPRFDGGWDDKLRRDLGSVVDGTRDPARASPGADALLRHPDLEVPS